jgi:uncharacterized damage-inducible protein DinB
MSVRQPYDQWPQYNRRLIDAISDLTEEQLAIRPGPDRPAHDHAWPIWGTVGHTAGVRVYWLCGVAGEPGYEATPFTDPQSDLGWEDFPDHPRDASELVGALETTFAIVDGVLDRWTPELLTEPIERVYDGRRTMHKRGEILQRLFTHEAYHCGELSQLLKLHDLPPVDLWDQDS